MKFQPVGGLDRGVEQPGGGKGQGHPVAQPAAARQGVQGNCAQRHDGGLQRQQGFDAWQQPVEGGDRQQDRLDMHAQAAGETRLLVGHAKPVAVRRVPDGLVQVAQVKRPRLKGVVACDGEIAEVKGVQQNRQRKQRRRCGLGDRARAV
jgi:hypothetical protein